MKTLVLIAVFFCLSCPAMEKPVLDSGTPERSVRTEQMSNDYKAAINTGALREKTNYALDAIIKLAIYQLNYQGKTAEANELSKEWEGTYSHMLMDRGMTDHKPLSDWLAEKGLMLQVIMGQDLFHSLRLDDGFITINFALPIVFGCEDNVSEAEYADHWVKSIYGYRGLGQVVVYWGSLFGCVGGTWGTGFLFCSPIAMGVEWISLETWIPALNRPLWELSCNQ